MSKAHVVLVVLFILIFLVIIFSQPNDAKFSVGGFVGPIPFAFSNNPELLTYILVLTGIIVLVIVLMASGIV